MSISAIMSGIVALAPTYDSDTAVRVWSYDNIKDTLNEASCPVRMLLANDDEVNVELEFSGINGASQGVTWQILDRVYLFPVLLGKGIEKYNTHYFNYVESYLAALKASRCLGTTNARVLDARISRLYPRAYPEDSEGAYWCIDVVLTVEEFI